MDTMDLTNGYSIQNAVSKVIIRLALQQLKAGKYKSFGLGDNFVKYI